MQFATRVEIEQPKFSISPFERIMLIGSCFADGIGERFQRAMFPVVKNPFGVMYNPVSVLHSVRKWFSSGEEISEANPPKTLSGQIFQNVKAQAEAPLSQTFGCDEAPDVVVFTLGTNHVYRLRETGEVVDNCQKRPHQLFQEEVLDVDDCSKALQEAVDEVKKHNPLAEIILTVSPIRYRKYGYHGSQLSKAVLLLAAQKTVERNARCTYFPAYELVNDELRDYRFYREDMLHPTEQAVDYIWERFKEKFLADKAKMFIQEFSPVRAALEHRPFNPKGAEYRAFKALTLRQYEVLRLKYNNFIKF